MPVGGIIWNARNYAIFGGFTHTGNVLFGASHDENCARPRYFGIIPAGTNVEGP